MTDLNLDAIEARANAASDGPWIVVHEPAWEADDVQHPDVIRVGAPLYVGDDEPVTICLVSTDYEDDPVDVLGDAEFIAHARTDVPALVALVRAKQAWIDGAKVDLDGYDEARAEVRSLRERAEAHAVTVQQAVAVERQRDEARAAIAAVRALHVKATRYTSGSSVNTHVPLTADYCVHCGPLLWPCATIRALDVRHDPSATTEGAS